jgi:hypothetical protein
MERWHVKPGQPHIPDDNELEPITGVLEPAGDCCTPGLVPNVGLPVERVRGGPGHHHLDDTLFIVIVVPCGAKAVDPTISTLEKLAAALGVKVRRLLE